MDFRTNIAPETCSTFVLFITTEVNCIKNKELNKNSRTK